MPYPRMKSGAWKYYFYSPASEQKVTSPQIDDCQVARGVKCSCRGARAGPHAAQYHRNVAIE